MAKLSYTRAHRPDVEQLTAEVHLSASETDDRRRFRMLGYTGAEVSRLYGRAVFDLGGIEHKTRVPILLNHDESQIAGFADAVRLGENGLELEGFLSSATPAGQQVAALSDEGFPWEASVGLAVSEWQEVGRDELAEVNGAETGGPISIGRRSRLLEVSFVTAGADKNTAAIALAAQESEESHVDIREELSAYLAEFDAERAGWAAQQFAEGKSLDEAKAALAAEEAAKADAAKDEALAAAEAKVAELEAQVETLAQLKADARHPGIGFDGEAGETLGTKPKTPQTPEEAWEQSESLRAEFGDKKTAWLALCAREGFNPEEAR